MLFALLSVAFGRTVFQKTPFSEGQYWELWTHFHSLEGQGVSKYSSVAEHDSRFGIFKNNMEYVRQFNLNSTATFELGITGFSDMTPKEFEKWLVKTSRTKPKSSKPRKTFDAQSVKAADDEVDWVAKGAVTPVKNQGSCGSCWAFSTTGGVEGANFLKNGVLSSFSEQELVDCSQAEGNMGCKGGLMDDGFTYAETDGLCFESDYPYEGTDGTCRKSSCTAKVYVNSYTDVKAGDVDALKAACSANGPISIAVDANMFWQFYSSGIFNYPCNPSASKLDHGVLLVGYSTSGGYWKVKNSWASTWGEKGYIRLKGVSEDTCGLAQSASWPTLK